MNDIILIGAGGHAKSCIDVIELENKYRIIGLVEKDVEQGNVLGYPVIGVDTELSRLRKTVQYAIIVIGQIKTPRPRINAFELLSSLDYQMPVIKSPLAHVSPHSKIGMGTIIMHGAIVNPGAKIGRNCIVNSKALVEHDVTIGDHCHIATSASVNGDVIIGKRSFVGSGSIIREGLTIEPDSLIKAGEFVRSR